MRVIDGRWIVGEPLGAGGMGSIFRGRHERLGTEVAIKILKGTFRDDLILRQRFDREAVALATLEHPSIVRVLDYGESDGDIYMLLELIEGETLEATLAREGAMPVDRAMPILDAILGALAHCHDLQITHRDVKPSNVMLSAGAVKLIDFGLAHVGGPHGHKLTETGTIHGTAQYMAPEQCRGEEVGPASDVYSTGVVAYEMLAGVEPFQGKDAATFMAQHLFVEPAPIRQIAPHLSAGIAAAIHAALAKQPSDRPTARELAEALANAAAGKDPEARADAAATNRQNVLGLPRSERAIGGGESPTAVAHGNVVVWMHAGERSAAIRSCLASAGLACTLESRDDLPVLTANDGAVIVSDVDRVERLRASKVPVVVVDVEGPNATTAVIRAGASDMLLRAAPDADLVAKLERLLRKRAR